jgi:2-phospho-L-lactate guanylyltransferase (CobY/MobA/RfbA family)
VLILPTDLPFLTPDDVAQLIRPEGTGAHRDGDPRAEPWVSIAPDRRDEGTNALYVAPPGLLKYAFGVLSFGKHLELARAAGASPRICRLPGVALDVDGPEDLELYLAARKTS